MTEDKKAVESDGIQKTSEELKKEKKKIIHRMMIVLAAIAVIIIALCIAWFASNRRVQATGSMVSADVRSVELKTYGSAGIHDDLLKRLTGAEETGASKSFWYEVKQSFETSPEKYAINWLLNDQSNIGNYSTKQSDWEEYWKNPPQGAERQDEALEPGTAGELTFYVVPKYKGKVELNMKLSMLPYKVDGNTFTEVTEENDPVAKNFVDGHILFCLEKGTDKNDIQWIKDGTFNITIEDAKKNEEYGYTLYWCWPQSFGEAVLVSGDSYLNGRNILFSKFNNGEVIRNTILQTDDLSMVKKPERYFYSNLTKNPLSAGQTELQKIAKMYNQSSESLDSDAKNAFVDLSSYYNQADQYIGSHVNCVRIRLTGEYE